MAKRCSMESANAFLIEERYRDAADAYSELLTQLGSDGAQWLLLRNRGLAYLYGGPQSVSAAPLSGPGSGSMRAGSWVDLARADLEQALEMRTQLAETADAPLARAGVDSNYQLSFMQKKLGEVCFLQRDWYQARAWFGKCGDKLWLSKCDAETSASVLPLSSYLSLPPTKQSVPKDQAPKTKDSSQVAETSLHKTADLPAHKTADLPAVPVEEDALLPAVPVEEDGILIEEIISPSPLKPIRHEWYQNDEYVIMTVYLKNLHKEKLDVQLTPDMVTVINNRHPSDPLFQKEDGIQEKELQIKLASPIDVAQSTVDHGKVKVELRLKKALPGNVWQSLEASVFTLNEKPAAYPTSNAKKNDWSGVQSKEDDKPEGDDALNKLFKEIYGNATEETRRAMVKSFQTSGGTVLSTNWDEVAKADYENKDRPEPPDGQSWKKW